MEPIFPTDAPISRSSAGPPAPPRDAVMRQTAREFEAVFLSEMLKHAGVGQMNAEFNGGPGEAAFSDMLVREYAREITRSGGLGLADRVLDAMRRIET